MLMLTASLLGYLAVSALGSTKPGGEIVIGERPPYNLTHNFEIDCGTFQAFFSYKESLPPASDTERPERVSFESASFDGKSFSPDVKHDLERRLSNFAFVRSTSARCVFGDPWVEIFITGVNRSDWLAYLNRPLHPELSTDEKSEPVKDYITVTLRAEGIELSPEDDLTVDE